jgi:predicted transcriptional regulator
MNRPEPSAVESIVEQLATSRETVTVPAIVAEIRKRIGCSRATAYRAVSDAFASGVIERSVNR